MSVSLQHGEYKPTNQFRVRRQQDGVSDNGGCGAWVDRWTEGVYHRTGDSNVHRSNVGRASTYHDAKPREPKLRVRHRPRKRKDKEHTGNVKVATGVARFYDDRDEHSQWPPLTFSII